MTFVHICPISLIDKINKTIDFTENPNIYLTTLYHVPTAASSGNSCFKCKSLYHLKTFSTLILQDFLPRKPEVMEF